MATAAAKKAPAKKPAKQRSKPDPASVSPVAISVTAIVCKRGRKEPAKPVAPPAATVHDPVHCDVEGCTQCTPKPVPAKADAVVRRVPVDTKALDVFRDQNGIVYLRVAQRRKDADYVVNKGFAVDLVSMPQDTFKALALYPVVGASILECAKRLLQPLNQSITIQQRAKEHLISITENEEIANMATAKNATKKFASVTAPAAKGTKAPKEPKAPKAAKPKGESNGTRITLAGKKIVVVNKEHGAREGTKRAQAMDLILASKNTDDVLPKLKKMGADPSFITFAVKSGFVKLQDAK